MADNTRPMVSRHQPASTDPLFSSGQIDNNFYYPQQEHSPVPVGNGGNGGNGYGMNTDQNIMEFQLDAAEVNPSELLENWDCLGLDLLNDPSAFADIKPSIYPPGAQQQQGGGGSTKNCSGGGPTPGGGGGPYGQQNGCSPSFPQGYQSCSNSTEQMKLFEHQQAKLRQTQQLQQQKLLELQQTILQAQLLKTKLSLASITPPNVEDSPMVVTQASSTVSTHTSTSNPAVSVPTALGDIPGLKLPLHRTIPSSSSSASNAVMRMPFVPERKTAHNAIERKYRLSINDRINDLRQIVTGGDDEQGKKLQKAGVLRKSIDYIRHLENTNRKLCEENRKLREIVGGPSDHIPITNISSPMNSCTSSDVSSPLSSNESGPHSPEPLHANHGYNPYQSTQAYQPMHGGGSDYAHQSSTMSSSESKLPSFLTSLLTMGDGPRVVMCVLMMFTLALVPSSVLVGKAGVSGAVHGGPSRSLSSFEDVSTATSLLYFLVSAVFRMAVAWLCVGWMAAHSLPTTVALSSREYATFWKFAKEASSLRQKGKYREAVVYYYNALASVGVVMASSSFTTVLSLVWQLMVWVYVHLLGGHLMVRLLNRQPAQLKEKEGVTPYTIAQVLHECHEVAMLVETHSAFKRWQIILTALNVAQGCGEVPGQFWMSTFLESLMSLPPVFVGMATWFSMFKARYGSRGLPAHFRWMLEPEGYNLLCSEEDIFEPRVRSAGPLGSPLLRATYIHLKQRLNETFQHLLYPSHSSSSGKLFADVHAQFRSILDTSRQVSPGSSADDLVVDSGFDDLTWWAAVGAVASKWLADSKDDDISEVYDIVESVPPSLTHNSDPLSSALLLAFRAHLLYRKEKEETSKILHLLQSASAALSSSVALPTDECSQTSDSLWQLGQILACDLLFVIRLSFWEQANGDGAVRTALCRGYHSDVDSLAQITATCSAPMPRLLLHKACLSVMNGSNPLETQRLLTGVRAWRKTQAAAAAATGRGGGGEHSYEEALGTVLAFKHLPGGPLLQEDSGCVLQEAAKVFRRVGDQGAMRRCYTLASAAH